MSLEQASDEPLTRFRERKLFVRGEPAEVRVCTYGGATECDVVVNFRGREMLIRCRNFEQAKTWAQVECRAYGVTGGYAVERY